MASCISTAEYHLKVCGFCREGEDEEEQEEEFGDFQLLTDDNAFENEEVSLKEM